MTTEELDRLEEEIDEERTFAEEYKKPACYDFLDRCLRAIRELRAQLEEEIEVAAAAIHDLQEQVNGMRPLTWRTRYTQEEVIEIFATAEHPITSIEHELLRRGIYPENKTEISMAYRFLEQGRLVCNGDIMVGSPAYDKLPDPKPEPIKYSDSDY